MYSLLLAIIYLSFISLGLPDSLLGSAWPVMHSELGVPSSAMGIITMIISGGTIISSLMSDRITKKIGAGLVTAISVFMTAAALFGFSFSKSYIMLCIWAVPYGLGAGAVDAALNNYVALHYSSRHMNWLHCFWGVGAAVSPYIMSFCLSGGHSWMNGYRIVGIVQIILTVILFISLPLWKKSNETGLSEQISKKPLSILEAVRIRGAGFMLITFFCYCAMEQTAILWASSYLVQFRGVDAAAAAGFAAFYCLGITLGRFMCGFISDRLGDKIMIRAGILVSAAGIVLVMLPAESGLFALSGLIIAGFGSAPIYPSIIHSTPDNFGKENSQSVIGIQMASAYMGSTAAPPIFGILSSFTGIFIFPFYLFIFALVMIIASEKLNKMIGK